VSDQHLIGTEGDDFLEGADGNDWLEGLAGNDTLTGNGGHDFLDGGAGVDTMAGGAGDEYYNVDDPADWVIENFGEGLDTVQSTAYSYQLPDNVENLTIVASGASGTGNDSANTIFGNDGDNFISGRGGDDVLIGLGGNDYMVDDGDGNDLLNGGAGSDFLIGVAGNDVYLPGFGGLDTVYDSAGDDEVRLQGVSPDQIERIREEGSQHLILRVAGTAEQLTLFNWFIDPLYQIERVVFDDGTVWAPAETSALRWLGTAGSETLQGTQHDETFEGRGGNDQFIGATGNDVYVLGDLGFDAVMDWGGEDEVRLPAGISPDQVERIRFDNSSDLLLRAGTEQLTLFNWFIDPLYQIERVVFDDGTVWAPAETSALRWLGTAGNDILSGTEHSERIEGRDGSDTLQGNGGDDILDGGAANDWMSGGAGADTYRFNRGYGVDVIASGPWSLGEDRLELGAGISLHDIEVSGSLGFLVLAVGLRDQVFIINDYPWAPLGTVAFSGGMAWDGATLERKLVASDDVLMGDAGSNTLDGGLGNDSIAGNEGDDFLYGDAGDDMLWGGAGGDTYFFGRGDGADVITGSSGELGEDRLLLGSGISMADVRAARSGDNLALAIDGSKDVITVVGYFTPGNALAIDFADGASWDAAAIERKIVATDDVLAGDPQGETLDGGLGNDSIDGDAGDDFLYGDAGNDLLWGGAGADTYFFGRGDGNDAITGSGLAEDRLVLGARVTLADVAVAQLWDDLTLTFDGSGEALRVLGHFADPANRLAEIRFADGASWDAAAIQRKVVASDDTLTGTAGADTLDGGLGNDWLYGGDGDDFLYGGGGSDMLRGGLGMDTYFFGRGDGSVTIDHYESMLENETLVFGAGITMAEVQVAPSQFDLTLTLDGGADTVRVMGNPYPAPFLLQKIRFADGASWDSDTLSRKMSATDDVLVGGAGSDTLDGGLGNDILVGFDGDDFLHGDAGTDSLHGGGGDDIFYFDGSSQSDVIVDAAGMLDLGFDTVRLGEDLASARVEFGMDIVNPSTLRLAWFDQGAELLLGAFLQPWNVERIDAMTIGQRPENHLVSGTGGDDVLSGSALFDIFLDGEGEDWLAGGAGNDLYIRGNAGGVDTISDVADAAGGNHLIFGGLLSADIQLGYDGQFLVLSGTWGAQLLKLDGFDSQNVFGGARAVQRFGFADGTTLGYAQLLARGFDLSGTEDFAGETIEGTSIHDRIHGLGGGDLLVGYGGDDQLYGGAGSDTLHGDSGQGDVGNDYLDGGAGNDSLFGWRGSDTYYFDRLSGVDSIFELQADIGDVDRVVFGPDITPDDLLGAPDQFGNLRIAIAGSTAELRFNAWFNPEIASRVERFVFQNGVVMGQSEIMALIPPVLANPIADHSAQEHVSFSFTLPPDTFADPYDRLILSATLANGDPLPGWLNFTAHQHTFTGTAPEGAAATITVRVTATDSAGKSVSDNFDLAVVHEGTITGTAANDVLPGTQGHDALFGLGGHDFLHGSYGNDRLFGGEGDDGLAGADGDDLLDGGAGADTLRGGAGNDVYVFARGTDLDSAWDVIGAAEDIDVVAVAADILPSDIAVTYIPPSQPGFSDAGFLLSIAGTADGMRVVWSPQSGPNMEIEEIRFASGTVWTETELAAMAIQNGSGPTLAAPLADQAATEDAPFSFTVPASAFADADVFIGDSLAYHARLADGSALPAWLAFDAATRTFSGTPENGDVGAISVRVTATDESGRTASDVFAVAVANTNDAPTLAAPIADQSGQETVAFSFTVPAGTFADVDAGDALTYAAGPLPAWLSFDAATRTFSGTPASADIGTSSIEVRASDSAGATESDIFTIAVAPAPDQAINGTSANDTLTGASGNDTLNGLGGADSMSGGLGNDTYFVDSSGDQVNESADAGIDTVHSSISYTLGQNVENLTLTGTGNRSGTGNALDNVLTGNGGNNALSGGAGNDIYYTGSGDSVNESAGAGDDTAYSSVNRTLWTNVEALVLTGSSNLTGTGNSGANLLRGNTGANTLQSSGGIDILEGGAGNDTLNDTSGNGLLSGGEGTDSLTGGSARELYIGGTGNDTITTGSGADIIAFNAGDGQDLVNASTGTDNTLSLGGGTAYEDLRLSRSGSNLVLATGATDSVTFVNWYSAGTNRSVLNLQVIAEAMEDFDASSSDPLLNRKVQRFDFQGLVGAFEASGLSSWALTSALLEFHLGGSDSDALGGDLAYRYGRDASLTGIGFTPAQQVLGAAQFGTQAQALGDDATLQQGAIRLG
jgi:Ca2+-binding RTX toxin-like protein